MASSGGSVSKAAYMRKVSVGFVYNGEETDMDANKIKYITIEHSFESNAMPIMYMSISVETAMYSKLIDYKETAKIHMRIQTYDKYKTTPLYVDFVNSNFIYFLSTENTNYNKSLSEANENDDSNYRTITIGLMDLSIMNSMKTSFCGIRKNIDQHTLVYNAIQNTKIIMKTPTYNIQYDTFIIPPLSSRKQMLEYIFRKDPFYDTNYLYFIDYDNSYLLDQSGDIVSSTDGTKDSIVIDVNSSLQDENYIEGMYTYPNYYVFNINNKDINVTKDNKTDNQTNQIVTITDSGYQTTDLDLNTRTGSTTKQIFQRDDHTSTKSVVQKNDLESAQISVNVTKMSIDSSILTPNKAIYIYNYSDSQYDGQYLLMYKKEVIYGASTNFMSGITFGLRKLNNTQSASTALSYVSTVNTTSKVTSTSASSNGYSKKTTTTTSSKKATSTSSTQTTTTKTTKTSSSSTT